MVCYLPEKLDSLLSDGVPETALLLREKKENTYLKGRKSDMVITCNEERRRREETDVWKGV